LIREATEDASLILPAVAGPEALVREDASLILPRGRARGVGWYGKRRKTRH